MLQKDFQMKATLINKSSNRTFKDIKELLKFIDSWEHISISPWFRNSILRIQNNQFKLSTWHVNEHKAKWANHGYLGLPSHGNKTFWRFYFFWQVSNLELLTMFLSRSINPQAGRRNNLLYFLLVVHKMLKMLRTLMKAIRLFLVWLFIHFPTPQKYKHTDFKVASLKQFIL